MIIVFPPYQEKSARDSSLADDLHIAVVDFIYNLWLHQRIVAVSYLKRQPDFWANLTLPLFDKYFVSKPKLNGCILRIISSEIYTYAGDLNTTKHRDTLK